MKGTLEKLRRMFSSGGKKRPEDDVTVSRFARSTSFKKASMRRSSRRQARKKAVVTNRGIYYVEDDGRGEPAPADADATTTLGSASTQSQSTISYSDWIQISDDDTLDRSGDRRSRRLALEASSAAYDSASPAGSQPATPPAEETLPVTSTFGSSCTSGVHSMEKTRLEEAGEEGRWARGGARRRPPTVVATRDNLRRSLRRLSGKKAKKAARRLDAADGDAPASPSIMDDEFYRRFARLPLVFAEQPAAAADAEPGSPTSPGTPSRVPFAFSKQNPITRWLEESEKLSPRAGFTAPERPLWSELVTRPARPADDRPAGRRPAKAGKRAARARTPSRKSMRRKLKAARPRVDAVPPSVAAAAGAGAGAARASRCDRDSE